MHTKHNYFYVAAYQCALSEEDLLTYLTYNRRLDECILFYFLQSQECLHHPVLILLSVKNKYYLVNSIESLLVIELWSKTLYSSGVTMGSISQI